MNFFPSLSAIMPDKELPETPFDLAPGTRSAYVDGFKTGREVMRNARLGSLVRPPQNFEQSHLLSDVWYDGVADGKWDACIEAKISPFELAPNSLGAAKLPEKTLFDSQPELRGAYLDGFRTGWVNMREGQWGRLVRMPDAFVTKDEFSSAWYSGLVHGKRSARSELGVRKAK
jgi:hypothetical protein